MIKEEIVFIKRKPVKTLNKDLKVMQDFSTKYMGSAGLKGSSLPITGLTTVEKYFIMPELVQISSTHNEFDKAVNDYFHDLREDIPAGKTGLKLNIATEEVEKDYNGKTIKLAMPVNPRDYILYKRAIDKRYAQCANSFEEAKGSGDRVKFYIHDVSQAAKVEETLGDNRDKAYSAYLDLVKQGSKAWEPILIVFGIDPRQLGEVDQKAKLRLIANADGIKDPEKQLERYKKFAELATDKNIEAKAELAQMIEKKVVVINNGNYIWMNALTPNDSKVIGGSETEAIVYMANQNNSKDLLLMRAAIKKLGVSKEEETED